MRLVSLSRLASSSQPSPRSRSKAEVPSNCCQTSSASWDVLSTLLRKACAEVALPEPAICASLARSPSGHALALNSAMGCFVQPGDCRSSELTVRPWCCCLRLVGGQLLGSALKAAECLAHWLSDYCWGPEGERKRAHWLDGAHPS